MTGEQRLALALELHELSCNIARQGIRHQHPDANPAEVERLLRHRIELSRVVSERLQNRLELPPEDSPKKAVGVGM